MLKIPDAILIAASTLAAAEFKAWSDYHLAGVRRTPNRTDLESMFKNWIKQLDEMVSKAK